MRRAGHACRRSGRDAHRLDHSEVCSRHRLTERLGQRAGLRRVLVGGPAVLRGCGKARRLAFDVADDKDDQLDHLMRGMDVLDVAVQVGLETAPDIALDAARRAGEWYSDIENWDQAARIYGLGLDAAERLVRVQVHLANTEDWLRTVGDLHSRAAHTTAEAGDHRGAALALDRGRAVVLSAALYLRDADVERWAPTDG